MCCIIHRPIDAKPIDADNIKKVVGKNPHGWGISYVDTDGTLFVEKSMEMSEALEAIRKAEETNREFIFHARWATHGEKNVENCHPFNIMNRNEPLGVMFHNGKMEDLGQYDKKMSDSWHFALKVSKFHGKKKRPLDYVVKTKYKKEVGPCRLAFLFKDGVVVKYGDWHEIDGSFYSKKDWQYGNSGYTTNYNYSAKNYSGSSYDRMWDGYEDNEWEGGNFRRAGNVRKYVAPDYDRDKKKFNPVREQTEEERRHNILVGQIHQVVSQGRFQDSYVDELSVEELEMLNEGYPVTMADFLYKMVQSYCTEPDTDVPDDFESENIIDCECGENG